MTPADVVTAHTEYSGLAEEVEVVEDLHRLGVPRVARRRARRSRRIRAALAAGRWRRGRHGFGADPAEDAGEVGAGCRLRGRHVRVNLTGLRRADDEDRGTETERDE